MNAARGEPVWFQLYATTDWNVTRSMVKRAEAAGCPVLVFTVDQISGTNRETLRRFERQDTRDCRALPRSHQPADPERAEADVQRTRPGGGRLCSRP